ncbi:MAG: hypothetical protein QGI25_00185 [Arenicellales bacterium]|jgi:sarcosine oxidase|nr:hypothetical protein [Arenicellales bacterium]
MSKTKVIVVDLGAHGSSTAYHLASRGIDVTGIDQFHPPHADGFVTWPFQDIQRYREGPGYVPMLQRARGLWNQLNRDFEKRSFQVTGGLFMGQPTGDAMTGIQKTSRVHNIETMC